MTAEKTSFQIEIRFDDNAVESAEIQALAEVLQSRGHEVSVHRIAGKSGIVRDLQRQAKEIRGIAENVRDAAESGMQMLRDFVEPLVNKSSEPSKNADDAKNQEKTNDSGFDDIGPSSASSASSSPAAAVNANKAIVVTSPDGLVDTNWEAMRIGFLPKTALDSTWQPSTLDAIVIPHPAFRPYLEYIHWDNARIFEGGYLALKKDCPSLSHEDALARFKLSSDNGPLLLVMASGFAVADLQTLIIQLSLIKVPMQIFFYHAGDPAKADQLRMLAQKFGVNARMFGRVDSLPDYIAMADVAVAQSDDRNGLLLQNAAVPTVYVVHREASARLNFLAHENAAILAPQLLKLSAALAQPVADANFRKPLRDAAENIAKLASIELCADAIEAALAKKSELIPEPEKRMTTVDGFETIGNMPAPAAGQNIIMPQAAPAQPFETIAPVQPVVQPAVQPVVQNNGMLQPLAPAPQPAPGLMPPPAPFLTPGLGSRSKEEIREDYTKLILAEKNLDKSLDAASAEVQKWEERLDLARQNNRDDLVTSALASLQNAKAQEMALFQQKDQIQQQKAVLKQSARLMRGENTVADSFKFANVMDAELFGPSNEELAVEKEFQNLQKESALQRLKKDLGKC